ncbi:MAG: aldo/keto reductase, partial [Bacillota bacterium]|nr:aldo/keto reductase [Bacillota bacterium]
MKKQKLHCFDTETSMLGFGCMRMPFGPDNEVDDDYVIDVFRHAIDSGITYMDTAYIYLHGKSEMLLGRALKDGYRQKTRVGTKLPTWLIKSEEDVERIFNEQLERLGLGLQEDGTIDPIDMYFVHQMNQYNWKTVKKYNIIPFLEKKKAEGYINSLGFSFHDDVELFKEIIDAHKWDYALIQFNYLDKNIQAGLEGLDYAKAHGVDIIVMEPLKGGRITDDIPKQVEAVWEEGKQKGIIEESRTPAETAFRWVAAHEGVKIILSGMSSKEQVDANVEIFSKENFGNMPEDEEQLIDRAADTYLSLIKYGCTECGYCKPCPQKIDIPKTIRY